jgi:hypothetical protein
MIMTDKNDTTVSNDQPLQTIAEALLEIGETLESILALMQEREAGFKARSSRPSYGDKPSYGPRKSYGRDRDEGGDEDAPPRRSYGPRKSFGDKPSYGQKKSFDGPKKFGGGKRSFGAEKKPYKPRAEAGAKSAPRKSYKGGY